MAHIYDPRVLYNPTTMPKVEGWELTNGCDFVRFHWVLTEADQKTVDAHWRPDFYRHSLINTMMSLATGAGVGVPGWDPFLGVDTDTLESDEYFRLSDQDLGTKIARGARIRPTGLADDPRLPERPSSSVSIVSLLQDAAARAEAEVRAKHAEMVADWRARKSGTWAQRAAAAKEPEPTLEDARRWRTARLSGPPREEYPWAFYHPAPIAGVWHEWEIVEIERERARQDRIERAWERAEAAYKSINPTWGGGT